MIAPQYGGPGTSELGLGIKGFLAQTLPARKPISAIQSCLALSGPITCTSSTIGRNVRTNHSVEAAIILASHQESLAGLPTFLNAFFHSPATRRVTRNLTSVSLPVG